MEIIDDLQRDGLVIVRSDSRFAYGHDAVLLTDFVRAHAGERYLDIGTGTGILAILTYAKCGVSFVAADIDGECVLLVAGAAEQGENAAERAEDMARELIGRGVSVKDAAKQISALCDIARNEAYALAGRIKNEE